MGNRINRHDFIHADLEAICDVYDVQFSVYSF